MLNTGSIITLFTCFAVTYIFEACFAVITGKRSKKALFIVFLANIITNPAANLVYWAAGRHFNKIILALIIEIVAVASEWGCYSGFKQEFAHPARFSIGANIISYVTGSIILLIIKGGL